MSRGDIKRSESESKKDYSLFLFNKSLLCYYDFMSVFRFFNKLYKILYIKSYKTYFWGVQSLKVYKHFYNLKYIFDLLNIYIVRLCRYIMVKETLQNELNLNGLCFKAKNDKYIKGDYLK